MQRFATAIETGTVPSFIRIEELPHRLPDKVEALGYDVTVCNASGKPVSLLDSTVITIQLGNSFKKARFFVTDKLASAVILGYDYCDLHLDAIRPSVKIVRIDHGSTVPILT